MQGPLPCAFRHMHFMEKASLPPWRSDTLILFEHVAGEVWSVPFASLPFLQQPVCQSTSLEMTHHRIEARKSNLNQNGRAEARPLLS